MTGREKLICRILLLIAGMFADNDKLRDELRYLSNSIMQYREVEGDTNG